MATVLPVPNIGSQIKRAVGAYLFTAFPKPIPNFYFSTDWKKRIPPLIDILAHKSTEEVRHSRVESYITQIEAKWPGTNQPGQTNTDYNRVQIDALIGTVMAAMSQTSDNAASYYATALLISVAGRRLAVLGTPGVSDASANDVSNNADMATFYCDFVEFRGSQRAEINAEGLFLKEVRNFDLRAYNSSDDCIFPALSFDGPDNLLIWTFTANSEFPEPTNWIVQNSVDGIIWNTVSVQAPGTRQFSINGTGMNYWTVNRSDDGSTLNVPESNIFLADAR
jgi:hypothetical protein